MKIDFSCFIFYVAIKTFKITRVAHIIFLLDSTVLESYI